MFTGSYTALVTPFKGGKVDEAAFAKFINWQIEQGTHGLVPCGTTGESPTLNHDEHNRVIELCVKVAAKRVPVIAGTGSNATYEAIAITQKAEKSGADGALIVVPYYNKPTPEGLFQHFKAIHDETNIPIILYNVPGRTVIDMQNDLIARLAELPRIVGIKDATGKLERVKDLASKVRRDFIQLSGEDDTAAEFNKEGGQGVITVSANVAPKLVAEVQNATLKGDWKKAKELQDKLMPLHKIMFCETSPGPVKYAVSLLGFCREEMRLPLVPPREENKKKIRQVMETLELI